MQQHRFSVGPPMLSHPQMLSCLLVPKQKSSVHGCSCLHVFCFGTAMCHNLHFLSISTVHLFIFWLWMCTRLAHNSGVVGVQIFHRMFFSQDVFFRKCSEVKTVKVLDLFNTFGIPASEGLSSTELQSMQADFGSDRHGIDFSVCTNMHVNRLENIPNFSHIHMHNFSHTNWQIQTNAFCWNKIVIYRTCTGKPAGLRTLNSKFETCS